MAGTIVTTQQIQITNGSNVFPGGGAKLGVSNLQIAQAAAFIGGAPGEIIAISTGQGTAVDLTALSVAAGGGWCMFFNEDPAITVTWGPDDGAGNIVATGDMLPSEPAGPFRCSAAKSKYRFKAASGSPKVNVFFFPA